MARKALIKANLVALGADVLLKVVKGNVSRQRRVRMVLLLD